MVELNTLLDFKTFLEAYGFTIIDKQQVEQYIEFKDLALIDPEYFLEKLEEYIMEEENENNKTRTSKKRKRKKNI